MKRGPKSLLSAGCQGCICAAMAMLLWAASAAFAHEPGQSFLTLRVEQSTIHGQVDIAVRDLEQAVGLDADEDGQITWAELRARSDEIAAFVRARLNISRSGQACPVRPVQHLVDRRHHVAYAVMRFVAECPAAAGTLDVTDRLMFDLDPQHRGLLRVEYRGRAFAAVFRSERATWSLPQPVDGRSRSVAAPNK